MTEKRAAVRDLYDRIKMAIDDVQYKQEKIKRKDHEGDNVSTATASCAVRMPTGAPCLTRLCLHCQALASTWPNPACADHPAVGHLCQVVGVHRGLWLLLSLLPAFAAMIPACAVGPDGCPGVGAGVHDGPAVR